MSYPNYQIQLFNQGSFDDQVRLLSSEAFWWSIPRECIISMIPSVFYALLNDTRPQNEWVMGLYIRAYFFKNNLLPGIALENHCSDKAEVWNRVMCSEYFNSWCKRDLIDFAGYVGLRGKKPIYLTVKDIFRVMITGLLRAGTMVKNVGSVFMYAGRSCILLTTDISQSAFVFVKGKRHALRSGISWAGRSSLWGVKAILKELGVTGVLYFKFSRSSLKWMLSSTIRVGYTITEGMLQWVAEHATTDNLKTIVLMLQRLRKTNLIPLHNLVTNIRNLVTTNDTVIPILIQLWNVFVSTINEILETGKDLVHDLRQISHVLGDIVQQINSSMRRSVVPLVKVYTEAFYESEIYQVGKDLTVFSARQLWNLCRIMTKGGMDFSAMVSTMVKVGFVQTYLLINHNWGEICTVILEAVENIGKITNWTVESASQIQSIISQLAINIFNFVAWDEGRVASFMRSVVKSKIITEIKTNVNPLELMFTTTNILSVMLQDLVFSSAETMKQGVYIVYEALLSARVSISPTVLYATAGLSVILTLYSLSDYMKVVLDFMKRSGRKSVCMLKEIVWYCLDVYSWNVDTENMFKRDLSDLIIGIVRQSGAESDVQLIEYELGAALNPNQFWDFEDAVLEGAEHGNLNQKLYDATQITKIKKIMFPLQSVVTNISEHLAMCTPKTEEDEYDMDLCFRESQTEFEQEKQRREEGLEDCIHLFADLNIRTRKDWKTFVTKNHTDKGNINHDSLEYQTLLKVLDCREHRESIFRI